jgi:Tol biopolymer transport system component
VELTRFGASGVWRAAPREDWCDGGPGVSGKVAFEGSGPQGSHIWVVDETGLGAIDLGGVSGARDSSPTWSPTGDRLAFSRFSSSGGLPHSDIWVMNADGTNPVQLTNGRGAYEAPAWSPDGTKIAYNTAFTIGVMNADGTNSGELTYPPNNHDFRLPAWSPDSTKLAFSHIRHDVGNGGMTVVAVINADGSGTHDLVSSFENGLVDADPAWSPDGSQILFISNRSGTGNVWVMNADGSGKANLTNSTFGEGGPTWSPDGTRIAFSGSRSGGSHIFTMQMRGSRLTRMFVHRYPSFTNRIATTRVGTWLMTGFARTTDLTAGLPTVACSNPTWSAA